MVGFLVLMVMCMFMWILEFKIEMLRKFVIGLRFWYEYDLVVVLLERGGLLVMGVVVEFILG